MSGSEKFTTGSDRIREIQTGSYRFRNVHTDRTGSDRFILVKTGTDILRQV
jgi:hypothetical protein